MTDSIIPIPACRDNYIWTIIHPDQQHVSVVDPGEAQPVLDKLNENHWQLSSILITHRHWDHTNGIDELLAHTPVPVFGPHSDKIPQCDHPLTEGDTITLPDHGESLQIIEIPGHTIEHIAFFNDELVFSGDTLFASGCGRVFDGTPEQMYASLQKLAALPGHTKLYCGHEYTEANLQFAKAVEPDNLTITARINHVAAQAKLQGVTLPSLLAQELEVNPFLRCAEANVQAAATQHSGQDCTGDPVATFAVLRAWKDSF